MRTPWIAATILLGMFVLTGCGAQPGKTQMTYDTLSSEPPGLTMVHEASTYALYPSDGTNPITTKHLLAGDQYGFVKDEQGKVVAAVVINGQQERIPLTSKLATAYYWKKQG